MPDKLRVILRKHRNTILVSLVIVISLLLFWAAQAAGKTLWDYLEKLIIPVVIGIVAFWFQRTVAKRDEAIKEAARERGLEIESDRQRQATLATYFDRMSDLLIKHNLREPEQDSEVRIVARARTVSALRNLDGRRIAQLIKFLTESNLGGEKLLTIELPAADLSGVDLREADLQGANLQWANLRVADLREANLHKAQLQWANLRVADLREANLQEADLWMAFLMEAKLRGAHLEQANLRGANLEQAYLQEADLREADLSEANLQGARLSEANLQGAVLSEANLQGAWLSETNLQGARLWGANLQEARLWGTNLQGADLRKALVVARQLPEASLLKNATMPNGMKYEQWIAKDRPDWSKGAAKQQADEPEESSSESEDEA